MLYFIKKYNFNRNIRIFFNNHKLYNNRNKIKKWIAKNLNIDKNDYETIEDLIFKYVVNIKTTINLTELNLKKII